VQEAFSKRDDLQREIKDVRGNLEVAVAERDQLQTDLHSRGDNGAGDADSDERIEKLSRELEAWQNRLPPLIERFRERDAEAEKLEAELEIAHTRILELEAASNTDQTHVAQVDNPAALTDGFTASNDALEQNDTQELEDDDSLDESQDEDSAGEDISFAEEDDPSNEKQLPGDQEPSDRLQQIKGIGPAIEKTLNEMGIFRYHQIAEMSEYDIDRVAQRLKGFRSRIYREDWIGQARDLRDQNASD
jgi:predicted flap endonuclease-1-like 5' DNA nuclease